MKRELQESVFSQLFGIDSGQGGGGGEDGVVGGAGDKEQGEGHDGHEGHHHAGLPHRRCRGRRASEAPEEGAVQ